MKLPRFLNNEIAKPALLLALFAFAGTLVLASVHSATAERIAANERQELLQQLNALVPAATYNNDPLQDSVVLEANALASAKPVIVYRARLDNQPIAAVFITTTPAGYNGDIRIAVGVRADQTLAGVRVLTHKETPGLGDRIDLAKSDWVLEFQQKSLQNPPPAQWAVKKDHGVFDQFTGATITPRAVVGAVKQVLIWHQTHQPELYALPANGTQP